MLDMRPQDEKNSSHRSRPPSYGDGVPSAAAREVERCGGVEILRGAEAKQCSWLPVTIGSAIR
jgi:hypothetical protein